MEILPLGVGGAFTKKYFHSNFLIDIGDKKLLVDAGTTLRNSLIAANIDAEDIDYILITHFHHDHVGGLSELLTKCYWRFENGHHKPHRPFLLLRPSQLDDMNALLSPTFNNQGKVWQDYCIPSIILNNLCEFDQFTLKIIPTDNLHCEGLISCGLKISETQTSNEIIISGDIKRLEESMLLTEINDHTTAIIQDISFSANPVHATIDEVLAYYQANHYPFIYGIHYEDHITSKKQDTIHLLQQGKPLTIKKQ